MANIRVGTIDIPVCDNCDTQYDDGRGNEWYFEDGAYSDALNDGWFERCKITHILPPDEEHPHQRRIFETVELLCSECAPKCPDCGDTMTADDEEPNGLRCETCPDEDDED